MHANVSVQSTSRASCRRRRGHKHGLQIVQCSCQVHSGIISSKRRREDTTFAPVEQQQEHRDWTSHGSKDRETERANDNGNHSNTNYDLLMFRCVCPDSTSSSSSSPLFLLIRSAYTYSMSRDGGMHVASRANR